MVLECEISLEKNTKTYSSGESIRGSVIIYNDFEINIPGLKLRLEGKCSVSFPGENKKQVKPMLSFSIQNVLSLIPFVGQQQQSGRFPMRDGGTRDGGETMQVERRSEEIYLDHKLEINAKGLKITTLNGRLRYEYPFEYILPPGLPSSFEGSHGNIRYKMTPIIPRAWNYICETVMDFYTQGILDLNFRPHVKEDVVINQSKNLGWFYSRGDIGFLFKMPQKGAQIGSSTAFEVVINNKSCQTVKAIVSVVQEVMYFAEGETRTVFKEIFSINGPSLPPGVDDTWSSFLHIPDTTPPTGLGGSCHFIDINYEVKMKLSGSHGRESDLASQTPIIIGTIALRHPQILEKPSKDPLLVLPFHCMVTDF